MHFRTSGTFVGADTSIIDPRLAVEGWETATGDPAGVGGLARSCSWWILAAATGRSNAEFLIINKLQMRMGKL